MTRTYPARTAPADGTAEAALSTATDCQESKAMTILSDAEHRAAVIDGLRRLATYLEEHPDVPVRESRAFELSYPVDVHTSGDDADHRAEVDRIAAVLGIEPETTPGAHYRAVKSFGGMVTYNAFAIPHAVMARYNAGWSYADSVTPGGE